MNFMNLQIIATIGVAFLISFLSLYFVTDWYAQNYERAGWEQLFYSQDFDPNTKKLFFLGSSFAVRINQTSIEETLSNQGEIYDVYNLGIPVDLPSERIDSIDQIISSKPDVVVYVIGFRDIEITEKDKKQESLQQNSTFYISKIKIPPLSALSKDNSILGFEISKKQNPKLISLQILDTQLTNKRLGPPMDLLPRHPFQGQGPLPFFTQEEMSVKYQKLQFYHEINLEGENAKALKQIVSKLSENDIKVFILFNPYHEIYLSQVPDEKWDLINAWLQDISKENSVHIIDLHDRYSGLNIWNDWRHIGFHTNSTIYYNDISASILEELSS